MSTHLIHPPGVAALKRWGVLEQLRATGCPPMTTYAYDMGPIVITGSPRPAEGVPEAFCPRRTVLDELLVRAAAAAGAELREGFTVDEILVEDGVVTGVRGHETRGGTVTERARVVVGADGRNSLVAKAVGAKCYNAVPAQEATYYAYWSGLTVAIGIRCIDEASVATASGTVRVPGTGRRRGRSYQLRAARRRSQRAGPRRPAAPCRRACGARSGARSRSAGRSSSGSVSRWPIARATRGDSPGRSRCDSDSRRSPQSVARRVTAHRADRPRAGGCARRSSPSGCGS
jgi:2-polyprenyl-6-methoxyphenol hydroxylase-like FAD-dependent oxidoreductase